MIDTDWVYGPTRKFRSLANGALEVGDHLGGFNFQGRSQFLDAHDPPELCAASTLHVEYILPTWVKQKYPQYNFKFDADMMISQNHFEQAIGYNNQDRTLIFDNFLCCFNKSGHSGRQWLIQSLFLKDWFNPQYCSKDFVIPHTQFNAKLHNFNKTTIVHGIKVDPANFQTNLADLSPIIKSSFLNLVSETVPESYVPFPTEKFLFPTLNRRLWIAYAQPGYYKFLTETLGFRLYDDFFDYSFDSIAHPQTRLSVLIDSIEPFSKLSNKAWCSIYKSLEAAIEYNYQWATSGQFIDRIRALNEVTKTIPIAEPA